MTTAAETVVDKSRFAEMIGRSAGRISQLIAEGKISGAALIGEGRSAKICVSEALRQLNLTLHPGQQLGQGRPIPTMATAPQPQAAAPQQQFPLRAPPTEAEDAQQRYNMARAEKAEHEAAEMRAKAAVRSGHWVEASAAAAAFARQLREFLAAVDAALPRMAEQLAADLGIEAKAATVILRQYWREFRTTSSAEARTAAAARPAALPEQHPDPDAEEDGAAP
jgi:hypothetical protein